MDTDFKYLTVNEADRRWGVYVTTLGHQAITAHKPYPTEGHPQGYMFNVHTGRRLKEYQLIFITEGEGYFQSSHQKPRKVKAGNVLFLFPDEWHTYYPEKEKGWTTYWIGFEGAYADKLVADRFFTCECPVLDIGLNESAATLYIEAIRTAESEPSGFQQILGGIATHLMGLVYSACNTKPFERNDSSRIVEQARILMKENVDRNIPSEEIAGRLGLGYSWFRKLFKNYTGLSPAKYQNQLRTLRAKEYLQQTTLSIKEIAYRMDFESITYFSAFFKKNTGLTPTEYINTYVLMKK